MLIFVGVVCAIVVLIVGIVLLGIWISGNADIYDHLCPYLGHQHFTQRDGWATFHKFCVRCKEGYWQRQSDQKWGCGQNSHVRELDIPYTERCVTSGFCWRCHAKI